jgi:hypothetical protein
MSPAAAKWEPEFCSRHCKATPVRRKATDCGEPLALSAMLSTAVLPPADTGLKVTEIIQLAPVANEAPQVFVNAKSSVVLPLNVMELIDSGAAPLLVKEIDFDADVALTASLPNARDVVLSVAVGSAAPMPLKATVWGEPLARRHCWPEGLFDCLHLVLWSSRARPIRRHGQAPRSTPRGKAS